MRNARFVTALVGAGALAACGGGGGGGGGTGVTVPPPVPTNLSETSVQRNDAQSALSGVQAYEEYAGGGSISTLTAVRVVHTMLAKLPARALVSGSRHVMTCTSSEPNEDYSAVPGANNTEIVTIEDFYDPNCTLPEAKIVWTASASGNNLTGPATFTQYSQSSGAVTSTADVQITFILNSADTAITGFSFLLSNVVDNGTAISGEIGLACNAGTATTCDIAVVANVAALSAEDGSSVSATATTSSISMQISDYEGAENSLSIAQGTFPAWVISPSADLVASVSIAGQATSSGFSLSLTDSTNGGTFAITGTSSGVTGTLTNNATGATVASFTVDDQGNGTLTYSNNSQVSIVDYIVQG